MESPSQYDVDPVRPTTDPTFDVTASGLRDFTTTQPIWERITAALAIVLRQHFSLASRIEHVDLVDRIWNSNDELAKIQIDSLAKWKPTTAGARPAVLIDRLDQDRDLANRAIGNQYQGVRAGHFAAFSVGQHVCHCLGGREGEVEILAWEVYRNLSRYAHVIRDALCLLRFETVKIGKRVQLSEEHKEHYTVPVLVMYAYQEAWRTYPTDESEITAIRASVSGLNPSI